MASKNKDKEYFQAILDKNKPHEKHYIDILDVLISEKGMKKKDILMLGLDKITQENSLKDAVKEGNQEVVEEIKDLKLMVKALASGNVAFTIESDEEKVEEIKTVEVDTSNITDDDLNF